MTELIRVETKSAWLSKINWTAILGAVFSLITANALGLEPETQVKVLSIATIVQSVTTIVFKTWFTPTITPASEAASGQKTMTLD